MPEPISARRLGELLSQLCAALGKPFDAKAAKMVEGYQRGLEDWPEEAIEWAVWRACKVWKARWFPKPAELAELCGQSPYQKFPSAPTSGTPGIADPCPDCGELWGWHRLAQTRDPAQPILEIKTVVRHLQRCSYRPAQDRWLQCYSYAWVDLAPAAGKLNEGDEAWKVAGVWPVIDPVPERPIPRVKTVEPAEATP